MSFSAAVDAADRSQDYRFEVVDQPVAVRAHREYNVTVTKASTGQPVENATIIRGRLEMTMAPHAHKGPPMPMATTMGGEVKVLASTEAETYRLMGDLSMLGTWKLSITAKVPDETQPISATATFEVAQ